MDTAFERLERMVAWLGLVACGFFALGLVLQSDSQIGRFAHFVLIPTAAAALVSWAALFLVHAYRILLRDEGRYTLTRKLIALGLPLFGPIYVSLTLPPPAKSPHAGSR